MIWLSFFLLSRIKVSIWALVASSLSPWFCKHRVSGSGRDYTQNTDLLSLQELLDSGVHALLHDSNLLVLLFPKTLEVAACIVQLGEKVVYLQLFRLQEVW